MIKNSKELWENQYGPHWLMAFLIGWQLLKFGDRIAEGEHWIGQASGSRKSSSKRWVPSPE